MPQIATHAEVKDRRTQRDVAGGHHVWRTDFIIAAKEETDKPQAFLIESTPNRVLRTHFHEVDQFQVVVQGDGVLAKHNLAPAGVHFARAFTPYGPITNGKEGLSFITLRARRDPGKAQFIPERLERLNAVERKPWQFTQMPQFEAAVQDVAVRPIAGMQDANGLAGYAVTLQPGATVLTPDPAGSEGQFVVVLKGSLIHDHREYPVLSVVFVAADEGAFKLVSGAAGLEAVVLNFPLHEKHVSAAGHRANSAELKSWQCKLCAVTYDEAAGLPDEGIPPGTRWADVPADWTCPDCAADKSGFEVLEL